MYKRDCTEIAEHGLSSPEGLVDIIEFTLCTIQAGLHGTMAQRQDIKKTGLKSRFLWGSKAAGLKHAIDKSAILWGRLCCLRENSAEDVEICTEAVDLLMTVPGLGLVKAAFVAQMLGFNVACLDSHNLKRLGKTSAFVSVSSKLKKQTRLAKISAYVQFCQLKGSEYWWDSWCEHVAGNRANKDLSTADLVSRWHVRVVKMAS